MSTPLTRRHLMVEMRQLIQLFGSQDPEVHECGWERGVHLSGCDAYERCEGECHLGEFLCEFGVSTCQGAVATL